MFLSYAHADVDGGGDSPLKIWSQQFYRSLLSTLRSFELDPLPRIFLDEAPRQENGLNRAGHLAPELMDTVRQSALLQIVMSPQYLKSEWCRRELEIFLNSLPDKKGSARDRVIIAKALDTDGSSWPAALCDEEGNKTVGWQFHDHDKFFPYGWMTEWGRHIPPEMGGALFDMAHFIKRRLEQIDDELTERQKKSELVGWLERGEAERIYLYGRSEDEAEWEAVWKEIDKLGLMVEPGEPEPLDVDDDSVKRNQYARLASRCDAMVMVGADGLKLDFDLDVVGRERRNFIASKYKKYLPCAVIDRCGSLARPARVSNAKRFGIDWIDPNACDWPDYIKTWLQSSAESVRQRYGVGAPSP
ncbi:MAG TPA: toll/interleukin-1 receptor domain-containing protein [Allosphingosinicella sp.]